jgi:3',5'-cyclic AMP phosphodiesterase CpdA
VILAQITDTHVLAPGETQYLDNNQLLTEAIRSLNDEDPGPDAVLGTGDLTNWARPDQYEQLAALIEPLAAPFLPLVGNHDDRDLMRRTFPHVPWADTEHASWVTTVGDVTVVGLDSSDPGHHGAAFDDDRATWLDSTLASSGEQPVVLALHHPPFITGIAWMDAFGFRNLDRLQGLIGDHAGRIARIVSGHIHRQVVTTVAGVTASICPATVHHVALDLTPASTPSIICDPRGYQLHLVDGGDVVTHTRYIDTGQDPFDPGWR